MNHGTYITDVETIFSDFLHFFLITENVSSSKNKFSNHVDLMNFLVYTLMLIKIA